MATDGQGSSEVKHCMIHHEDYTKDSCIYCDGRFTASQKTEKSLIKSDGGSSSYYQYGQVIDGVVHLMETRDFVRNALGNDFDLGNIAKALKRIAAAKAGGGKEGASIEYDLNKIIYTAELLKSLL